MHSKSKRNFKSSGGNIKSEDHGYRTQGWSRQIAKGHWCLGSRDAE